MTLQEIKENFAKDAGYRDWQEYRYMCLPANEKDRSVIESIIDCYAQSQTKDLYTLDQVRESIRLSLEEANKNAKVDFKLDSSLKFAERSSIQIDSSSILSESNYKIVNKTV